MNCFCVRSIFDAYTAPHEPHEKLKKTNLIYPGSVYVMRLLCAYVCLCCDDRITTVTVPYHCFFIVCLTVSAACCCLLLYCPFSSLSFIHPFNSFHTFSCIILLKVLSSTWQKIYLGNHL